MKEAPKIAQLRQSGKFCGVISKIAADPIRPITTGRIPLRAASNHWFSLNFTYILQISKMIIKEGRHAANVATAEPKIFPVTEYPIYVALLIPMGPGVVCEIAMISVKVAESIQW